MAGLDKFLYNFARRFAIPMVKLTGRAETMTAIAVSTIMKDSAGKILQCSGATVPTDASTGFAKGCEFILTSATTGIGGIYVNIGTSTACVFVRQPYCPRVGGDATIYAAAASGAVTAANISGCNVTNTGAGALVLITLPAVATMAGKAFRVYQTVAQITNLSLAAVSVYLAGSGVAGKYLSIPAVIGNYADIYCDGVAYYVEGWSGVLTKEA